MAVAYPTVIYGESSTIEITPRLIRGDMGDGNQFVAKDGINHLDISGVLEHPLLDSTEAGTLRTFLQNNTGGEVVTILNKMQDNTGATTMNVILLGWTEDYAADTTTFRVSYQKVNRS
jgi:hypothetical protein